MSSNNDTAEQLLNLSKSSTSGWDERNMLSKRMRRTQNYISPREDDEQVVKRQLGTVMNQTSKIWERNALSYDQFVPMGYVEGAYAASYNEQRLRGGVKDREKAKQILNCIYARRLLSVRGKRLAYDELLSSGGAYYLHYLPSSPMLNLLMELKGPDMTKYLDERVETIDTCHSTQYYFSIGKRMERTWVKGIQGTGEGANSLKITLTLN